VGFFYELILFSFVNASMIVNDPMTREEMYSFLEMKVLQYNTTAFIDSDPVSVPHRFTLKEDIEISGFLTATLAWGQRKSIIQKSLLLMKLMDEAPYDFIMNANGQELKSFENFVYRTFNGTDCCYFILALQHLYREQGGMESAFSAAINEGAYAAISHFRSIFIRVGDPSRTGRHLANPLQGSAAKRLNMFLRWMVRKDDKGVDFGIWKGVSPALLICPLDVHSGRVARKLGLLTRNSNDRKAAEELTSTLRSFDPADPVKYDYALFGLGVFEQF
jgi:uncharacterized protein (TIGR02757 family)